MKQEGMTEFDKIKATIDDLELGKVALFGFKPGGGKSTLLTNLIYNYVMQDGNNVLHVTLEDFNPEYISKLQSYYHNLANIGGYGNVYFKESTPLTLKVDDLKQMILSVERLNDIKIDMVVLDYVDLLKRQEYSDNEAKAGESLFRNLVKLAKQTDTLVITATQLNRGANIEEGATLIRYK